LKQIRIFSVILILTFLILAGCGGGGGGDSSSNTTGNSNTGNSNTGNTNNNSGNNSGGVAAISLAWDANTTPGIAGYKVHYGTSSGNLSAVIDVGNMTNYTVSNLQSGITYYLAVSDYNTSGQQSGYSNEISGTAR